MCSLNQMGETRFGAKQPAMPRTSTRKTTLLRRVVLEPWLSHPVTEKSLKACALIKCWAVSYLVDSEWSLDAERCRQECEHLCPLVLAAQLHG